MSMDEELARALAALEREGLLRTARRVDGPQGPEMTVDGRRVICLCSNNYLGLANDPAILAAARGSLETEGLGAGASRSISGTMHAHRQAEAALASFVQREAALLFASGWAANLGTIQALVGEDDVVFSDELNHASLIDGCRLSRARVVVYPHNDTDRLAEILATERSRARRALVVTDAVFSMDGDRARTAQLRQLCDAADAWLMVDEAHALGVIGPEGRGLCAADSVVPDVLMGTLGKALGAQGAFVAGSSQLVRFLENRARSYVFSTAPSPLLAAAATRAVALVRQADDRRERVLAWAARLRTALAEQGWDARGEGTCIVPVVVGHPDTTMRASKGLFDRGVFAHGVRPPTVPAGTSRIRVVPMATHEERHIDRAIEAFAEVRAELRR